MPKLKVTEADMPADLLPSNDVAPAEQPAFRYPEGVSTEVTFSDPTVTEAAHLATAQAAEVVNVPVQVQGGETKVLVKQG